MRALFARLQQRSALLKSISLLDCLLAAHAAIVSTSESLAAGMGNAGGPEAQQVLQVCNLKPSYYLAGINVGATGGGGGRGGQAHGCTYILLTSNTCIICSSATAHTRSPVLG